MMARSDTGDERRGRGVFQGALKWSTVLLGFGLLALWVASMVRSEPAPAQGSPPTSLASASASPTSPATVAPLLAPGAAPPSATPAGAAAEPLGLAAAPPRLASPPPGPAATSPARRLLAELDTLARPTTAPAAAVVAVIELDEYLPYPPSVISQAVWDEATARAFVGDFAQARAQARYRSESERLRLALRPVRARFAATVCATARPAPAAPDTAPHLGDVHVVRAITVWWTVYVAGERQPSATVQEFTVGRDSAGRWRVREVGLAQSLLPAGVGDELLACAPARDTAALFAQARDRLLSPHLAPDTSAADAAGLLIELLSFASPSEASVGNDEWEAAVYATSAEEVAEALLTEARGEREDLASPDAASPVFGVRYLLRTTVCAFERPAVAPSVASASAVALVEVLVEQWIVTVDGAESLGPFLTAIPVGRDTSGRWVQVAARQAVAGETVEERVAAIETHLGKCTAL